MVTPVSDIMREDQPMIAVYQQSGTLCPGLVKTRLRWYIHTLPADAPADDYLRALVGLVVDYYRHYGRNLLRDFVSMMGK